MAGRILFGLGALILIAVGSYGFIQALPLWGIPLVLGTLMLINIKD